MLQNPLLSGRPVSIGSLLLVLAISSVTPAEETSLPWPFRSGPTLDGHVAAADARDLPTEFDEASGSNIRWKTPWEGFGHSTPVIGNGKVWMTAATEDGRRQYVYGIDADSGAVLHHRLLFENENPEPLDNDVNTYASPSCALDDKAVYVHFGSYGTARLDASTAEIVWQRRDIKCRHYRGPGSSPILFQDLLILTFDGIDAQFLMALNRHTGETVWRTDRSTDYGDLDENGKPRRDGDLRKAYSTPGLIDVDGRTQVVSVGSRAAFGYDALTGTEIWGIRHQDFNAAAPPVFRDGLVVLNTGSRGANLMAVRLDATTRGDVTDSHIVWDRDKGNSRLAAPLLLEERVYMITDAGVAICVDVATGEEIWKGRVGGMHVASPITANGYLYFCNEEGDVTVLRAGDKFDVVSANRLADGMRASPAVADGRLYLRTFRHLYCVGH
ncbi:MAG: PQQ-binding-like beta-propeller repeat protein [Fuerstiella sp.]